MSLARMKEVWNLQCDTPGQKLVLLALADSEREDAGCWPSLSTLQKKCSMSRQGVLNSLSVLERKGWISADRSAGKSSVYRVTIPVHAMDYLPEKKHAFQPVHAVDQSTQLTSPESGLPLVNSVDYHQSTELTGPVHRMDTNRKETKEESKVEPPESPEPEEPDSEPALVFPCTGNPKLWALTETKLGEWQDTYEFTDVLACCRKALQWVRDNPSKRKTATGMTRFLGRWISSAADKGESRLSEKPKELSDFVSPYAEGYTDRTRAKWAALLAAPLPPK